MKRQMNFFEGLGYFVAIFFLSYNVFSVLVLFSSIFITTNYSIFMRWFWGFQIIIGLVIVGIVSLSFLVLFIKKLDENI